MPHLRDAVRGAVPLSRIKRRGKKVCCQCGELREVAYYRRYTQEGVHCASYRDPVCGDCQDKEYHAAREANRLRRQQEEETLCQSS